MKSKIKIIIVVFILLLVGIVVAIPKATYQKWFGKEPVDSTTNSGVENETTVQVYVMNEQGYLVGLNVTVEEELEDDIIQKWNILTKDSSMLPKGYTSLVNSNTVLSSYEIKGTTLVLNISEDIYESNGRKTLESLAWTYGNDEIENIELYVDDIQVVVLNNYHISKINKNMGINLEYETSYLLESNATTIVYCEQDYLLPVTYFHLEQDICTYIVNKTANYSGSNEVWDYKYELIEDTLIINFVDNLELNEQILASLTYSFAANFELSKLTINNVEKNLYEAVFGQVVDE